MKRFETDTKVIVSSFVAGQISFIDCVHGLDAALNRVIPTLTPRELKRLQAAILANKECVLETVQRLAEKAAA